MAVADGKPRWGVPSGGDAETGTRCREGVAHPWSVHSGGLPRPVCPAARVDRSCRPALFPHRLMVGVKALAPALPATAAASQGKLGGQDAALRCGPPFLPFLFAYLLPPVLGLLFECPMGTRERRPCFFGSSPC